MSVPSLTIQQAMEAAIAQHRAGRLGEAERIYRQILGQDPRHPEALHLLGVIAHQVGRNDVAVDLIQRAIAFAPGDAAYHSNLGEAYRAMGKIDEALASYRRALAISPDFVDAHNNLGSVLTTRGLVDEAIVCYQRVLALQPDFAYAHNNLGNALAMKGLFEQAITSYQRALALQPDYADAHNNLAYGLLSQGRLEEAVASYQRAVALKPDAAEQHSNLGHAFQTQGRLKEAIASYQRALGLKPDCAPAHLNLGMTYLVQGSFPIGWVEYEWRWKCADHAPARDFPQPQWEGGELGGRPILLHAEQGIGDVLQFIRYVPLVLQRGGRVIVECHAEILRLIEAIPGIDRCLARGMTLPPFDVHCPLLSLPGVLGTTLENIPAEVPYLFAPAEGIEAWSQRLGTAAGGLKVGLAWAGNPAYKNDRMRSPRELALLAPLAEARNVRFYSLQKGQAGAQAKSPPAGMHLTDWTEELHDFAQTAALLANLDLVISSDTAVAHLAGAMGKPVWVMLPFAPDWRWLLEREDSPWYPTMRLFRQSKIGDWAGVARRVADALCELASSLSLRGH